jgi:hypothetical protein
MGRPQKPQAGHNRWCRVENVDAVIALMAALEGAERQPVETRLVGWV